jgi:hypothetical protein
MLSLLFVLHFFVFVVLSFIINNPLPVLCINLAIERYRESAALSRYQDRHAPTPFPA